MAPFFIDKFPVTNAQFKEFLDATHYAPRDAINFLRDWKDGELPQGLGEPAGNLGFAGGCAGLCKVGGQAVAARVGVATGGAGHGWPNLSLGKPVAACQCSHRRYRPHHARPRLGRRSSRRAQALTASWTWWATSGSGPTSSPTSIPAPRFCAAASITSRKDRSGTFPKPYRNDEHSKLLLMAPGYDRSGGVGFRCVRDAM